MHRRARCLKHKFCITKQLLRDGSSLEALADDIPRNFPCLRSTQRFVLFFFSDFAGKLNDLLPLSLLFDRSVANSVAIWFFFRLYYLKIIILRGRNYNLRKILTKQKLASHLDIKLFSFHYFWHLFKHKAITSHWSSLFI